MYYERMVPGTGKFEIETACDECLEHSRINPLDAESTWSPFTGENVCDWCGYGSEEVRW